MRSNFQMMQRISVLAYIDSQMYKLTIRMHLDQLNAVQKEKFHFFTTHPIFSIASPCTLSNEKEKDMSIAFFKYISRQLSTKYTLIKCYKRI